ncbi:hypothetical protein KY331_00120 [Candidatus Woesearchaeota archaeon]|nr:hypothetical protein [Candidatus Woesearchaeota archaeon]
MDQDTEASMKRNNQTLHMLVSFPPGSLDGVMGAITQDEALQGIELKPRYDSSKPPRQSYRIFEEGTEIAKIVKLNKNYSCVFVSEGETAKRLREVVAEYSK